MCKRYGREIRVPLTLFYGRAGSTHFFPLSPARIFPFSNSRAALHLSAVAISSSTSLFEVSENTFGKKEKLSDLVIQMPAPHPSLPSSLPGAPKSMFTDHPPTLLLLLLLVQPHFLLYYAGVWLDLGEETGRGGAGSIVMQ